MSIGVGVIAAVSGSVPAVPGPRPAEPSPPDLPAGLRPAKPAPGTPRPSVPPAVPAPRRVRTETSAVRAAGLPPVAAAAPGRIDPILVTGVTSRDLVRRLAEAVQSARVREGSCVRMTLRPAHLGELWIELLVVGSRLRGRVRTETEAARDLLLSRLDDLRAALKRMGIDLKDLAVEVGRSTAEEPDRRPRSHRRQILDFRA